jgi:hypothetical protein
LQVHHRTSLPVDLRQMIELSTSIDRGRQRLQWSDFHRFSRHQERHVPLGGLTGRVTYTGALSPFVGWLALGSVVHVGKATTFGMGGYRMRLEL